jgi:hypothetical protein
VPGSQQHMRMMGYLHTEQQNRIMRHSDRVMKQAPRVLSGCLMKRGYYGRRYVCDKWGGNGCPGKA